MKMKAPKLPKAVQETANKLLKESEMEDPRMAIEVSHAFIHGFTDIPINNSATKRMNE